MKTIHTITLSLAALIFWTGNCWAQLYFDKQPYHPVYSEIQFAHLPDPDAGSKGHLFFIIKKDKYDQFTRARSNEALIKQIIPQLPARYHRGKYHFTHHQVIEEELVSASGAQLKSISDTLFVALTATRNVRRWSWRKFARTLRPLGTDTLYRGYVASSAKLQPARIIYDYELATDSVSVKLKAKYGPNIEQTYSTFGWPAISNSLILPVNELLPRLHYLVHGLDSRNFNIMLTKGGVTMYSGIKP